MPVSIHRTRALALVSACLTLPAIAATIPVDGTLCTLPDAIGAANGNTAVGGCVAGNGADTLELGANVVLTAARGGIVLGGAAGLPDISSTITLVGSPGGTVRLIQRNSQWQCAAADPDAFRLFTVTATGNLTLRNLTLKNGCVAPFSGDAHGGAILVDGGDLTLDNVTVDGHRARSGAGGEAGGGAIAVVNGGDVRIDASRLENNLATSADNLADDAHSGAAYGGALSLRDAASRVSMGTSIVRGNVVLPGSAESAAHGCGGAIALRGGTLSLRSSLLTQNTVNGGATTQSTPGIGRGGALCQTGGTLGVIGSALVENDAIGGAGLGQFGDGDGMGGGISVTSATQSRLENVTISGNRAAGGHEITRGIGGGVVLETAGVVLARVTVAGNTVEGSAGSKAGGLWITHDATIFQSIFADNADGDCRPSTPGLDWSAGYNLVENSGCTLESNDISGLDPRLEALADNGCVTGQQLPDGSCAPTHAIAQSGEFSGGSFLRTASPALDASLCIEGPGLLDQRGYTRPQDIAFVGSANTTCDIGAFEAIDSDADGITNTRDACLGNDASGDVDDDHVCADRDDNDNDPTIGVSLFADGFE
ncbi:choice-of-anchor Q domain-containing protein [Tahibacter amnicola]|uniref:CSLREA domain-containing protein n=1 Tax=Tahibacter amnicola TaxID=2976241 RepID=A0ABY6BLC7_9GAMM|nr:choice-of-anchor Q domain-containing protein [Tahibacter amnicola]UXI70426.1 hypothetical protein N4264_12555 [Tahibacter amnicola]